MCNEDNCYNKLGEKKCVYYDRIKSINVCGNTFTKINLFYYKKYQHLFYKIFSKIYKYSTFIFLLAIIP